MHDQDSESDVDAPTRGRENVKRTAEERDRASPEDSGVGWEPESSFEGLPPPPLVLIGHAASLTPY
jgi:hypothetical protein